MTWLQLLHLLMPGLIALIGAWRANAKNARRLAALEAKHGELLNEHEELAALHAQCERNVDALRDELGLKRREENAGGGSLLHAVTHTDETRKR
jgi:hypothetical protein